MKKETKRKTYIKSEHPVCTIAGPCFARRNSRCTILIDSNFKKGKCTFQKAKPPAGYPGYFEEDC